MPQTLQIFPYLGIPNTFVIASTYPVVDIDDNLSSLLDIEPPWEVLGNNRAAVEILRIHSLMLILCVETGSNTTNLTTESIQVRLMACEIGIHNGSADIILTPSLHLNPDPDLSPGKNTLWNEWRGPGSYDPVIGYVRFIYTCATPHRLTRMF